MPNVAPGIITQGLGGNASNMILGHFHLGFFEGTIIIPPIASGAGGVAAYPSIRDDDELPQRKIEIIIKVRFGKWWHERIYWMLPKNVSIIIKIFNILNTTNSRVKFIINDIFDKTKSIITSISNIRNKSN